MGLFGEGMGLRGDRMGLKGGHDGEKYNKENFHMIHDSQSSFRRPNNLNYTSCGCEFGGENISDYCTNVNCQQIFDKVLFTTKRSMPIIAKNRDRCRHF